MAKAPQGKLKDSVYALEDPSVPGLYIRLDARSTLTPRDQATLAPATWRGRVALCARAVQHLQQPHELVRIDA